MYWGCRLTVNNRHNVVIIDRNALSESKCSMYQPSCTIGKCIAMFLQNPVCIMNVGHLGNGDRIE